MHAVSGSKLHEVAPGRKAKLGQYKQVLTILRPRASQAVEKLRRRGAPHVTQEAQILGTVAAALELVQRAVTDDRDVESRERAFQCSNHLGISSADAEFCARCAHKVPA